MVIDQEEEQEEDWHKPIMAFLENNPIPDDDAATELIARKSKLYVLEDGILYKRGLNGVLLRCITSEEVRRLLEDIHGGICGAHAAYRTLIGKAFRHGFYWPTAKQDALHIVKTCEACQCFSCWSTRHA